MKGGIGAARELRSLIRRSEEIRLLKNFPSYRDFSGAGFTCWQTLGGHVNGALVEELFDTFQQESDFPPYYSGSFT